MVLKVALERAHAIAALGLAASARSNSSMAWS